LVALLGAEIARPPFVTEFAITPTPAAPTATAPTATLAIAALGWLS
jgi:hypothetical protein